MPKTMLRLHGVALESIVDGPGLRHVIFTQGCPHACPGCHNPDSHDLLGGYLQDTDSLLQDILQNPLLSGVTFSGGEPFLQAKPLCSLAKTLKEHRMHIAIYTGYMLEILQKNTDPAIATLLDYADMLIDGPYVAKLFHEDLLFRGSSNQRIWQKDPNGIFCLYPDYNTIAA